MNKKKKIELQPFTKDHVPHWYRWRKEPNLVAFNPVLNLSIQELEERIGKQPADFSKIYESGTFRWVVKLDNTCVGTVALTDLDFNMGFGEIGYGIGEDFQGKGFGQQAVRMLIEKIFGETEIRRLVAYVCEKNLASRTLLENLGFQKEGLLREHYIINGVPENEFVYGLLRDEFV